MMYILLPVYAVNKYHTITSNVSESSFFSGHPLLVSSARASDSPASFAVAYFAGAGVGVLPVVSARWRWLGWVGRILSYKTWQLWLPWQCSAFSPLPCSELLAPSGGCFLGRLLLLPHSGSCRYLLLLPSVGVDPGSSDSSQVLTS